MIRSATKHDARQIRAVHSAAFPSVAEADLVDQLEANGNLLVSLVACDEHQLVGHLALSPVTLNDSSLKGAGLAPVAVLPAHQRRGWGSQLIRAGLHACRELAIDFVVVLGEPTYYQRFGFRAASSWQLENEYGADDAFMALPLTPDCLLASRGLIRYGEEFRTL